MDGKLRNMTSLYLVTEGEALLLHRVGSRVANNKYVGTAGGHFEERELSDARACVVREMEEELGLAESDVEGLRLRYITHRLKDGEIRQNYYFFARLKEGKHLVSNEGTLHWISWENIPGLDMPVSAKHMILHYIKQGRYDEKLYGGITCKNGTAFAAMEEFEG